MGYANNFMTPTLQTIADFHQHLSALVQLLTTDSTSLYNQATSLHATSIQGATADALVRITETYHEYVSKNTDPVSHIVAATQTFHDVISTLSATCDNAISMNSIADYLFATYPLFDVQEIISDPYNAIDNAVATAYKALAYPNGVPVHDGAMTTYDADKQAAKSALETWASALQNACFDWNNAIGIGSSSLPASVPRIPGVTVDPQHVQTLFNDINTIGAPNGVVNAHLSAQDTTTANDLFLEWQEKAPGLTLGFIEAMMAAKFSQAQIVALLDVWPNIDWRTWVVEGGLLLKLLLGGYHLYVEKHLDVVNTTPPRSRTSAPVKGAKGSGDSGGSGGDGEDPNELTLKGPNGSVIKVRVGKPTDLPTLPSGGLSGSGGTTPEYPAGGGGKTGGSSEPTLGPDEPIDPLEPLGPGEFFDI